MIEMSTSSLIEYLIRGHFLTSVIEEHIQKGDLPFNICPYCTKPLQDGVCNDLDKTAGKGIEKGSESVETQNDAQQIPTGFSRVCHRRRASI